MKIPWKEGIAIVLGDGEILIPVCRLEEGGSELQMSGLEFMNMVDYRLKDEKYATALFLYFSHKVIAMMKNMGYMPCMGLGDEGKGVVKFPNIKTKVTTTLNGNFVKEGGDFLYCGFPKPWVGKHGRVYPGWEMFFNEKLTFKEKPTMVIKEM